MTVGSQVGHGRNGSGSGTQCWGLGGGAGMRQSKFTFVG